MKKLIAKYKNALILTIIAVLFVLVSGFRASQAPDCSDCQLMIIRHAK